MNKLILILIALSYSIGETVYFGNNLYPHTDAEVIADGIALLLAAIAISYKQQTRETND